jgi:hypothetical protein
MLESGSVAQNLKLLIDLFWRPGRAMSAILDRGSLIFASIAALAASLFFPVSFYSPLLLLAAVYVPGILLIGSILGGLAGVSTDFRRDYSPLLTCVAMGWTDAALLLHLLLSFIPGIPAAVLGAVYFTFLVFFAVRTVFGASNGPAAGISILSWLPMAAVVFFWAPIRMMLGWVASPFFLFYIWYYLGGEFSSLGAGLRDRQTFRRMLEAAAINPHDGDAQYQLGLIHQQRRQYTEAVERFRKAVQIDPTETDAHFQLGRIAREQGRPGEALEHFRQVLKQDDKHSLNEIHRETGAAYFELEKFEEARRELEIYTDRRPHDPEGLYYFGRTLEALGVEAARTAPRYRRRFTARWSRLAQKQLRR